MIKSLEARVSSLAESEPQVIKFERPVANPIARRRNVGDAPCANCGAHKQAICSGLKSGELDDFSQNIRTRIVKAGQSVYREFEEAKNLYTVVSGEIRLANLLDDGRRQVTAFKSAGDVIGEHQNGYYQSDAEAVCDTVVCQIPIKIIDEYLETNSEVRKAVSQKMQEELLDLRHHAILLGRKTPVEKIATFLIDRAKKDAPTNGNEVEVILKMGRSDIADFLGLTIETVSRTITKLKNMGVLEVPSNNSIIIKDYLRLEILAEGEK